MAPTLLSAVLFLAGASASWADDDHALLPTHLIEGGQVFTTATLRYFGAKGDTEIFGAEGDIDQRVFQLQLDAGIGLGMGFEIDATLYYQFLGETNADFSAANTEFETEDRGFSDLILSGRYRLLKDDTASPQFILGVIVVAPVGNDKEGQAETKVNNVVTVPKEKGGIGDGVWHYGIEAGISKNLGFLEPYLTTSYVFGDKRSKNGVDEDRADVWTLTLGAQWKLTPQATLDTRAVLTRQGVDETEDAGTLVKEESHFNYTGAVSLYVRLGGPATLVVGGGVIFVEDHELNDAIQLTLKDDKIWFLQIGLHLLLGGK